MRIRILLFMLAIAMLMAGCGMEDINASNEVQTETEYDTYMTPIRKQSAAIKNTLENEELNQGQMNEKAMELYELWDGVLNELWAELKTELPEEDFSKLLDEQRQWIKDKEKAVEEAGKEYKDGSLYGLVINMEAAKITEERVYELYKILEGLNN